MNRNKTSITSRRRTNKRRRRFAPLAVLALATVISFGAKTISLLDKQVMPLVVLDMKKEGSAQTSDTAHLERMTVSLDEAETITELCVPSSPREENSTSHKQTANSNIKNSIQTVRQPNSTKQPSAVENDSVSSKGNAATDNWNLALVNPWNTIPNNFSVTLTQLKNGQAVDKRCYPDLQEMMNDCREKGLSPLICSSYRTQKKQESLFDNKVSRLMAQGYTKKTAKIEAGKSVAVPGTSEHQLGLAVDIVDINNQSLDESQERTAAQKWLMKNSWKYGFILRYPNGKSDITGIIYEPWHYRYVGKDAAKEIYEQGICLEEYLM